MKLSNSDAGLYMGDYINTSKALAIISGILLSVVIAFSIGALVQFFLPDGFSHSIMKNALDILADCMVDSHLLQ